MKDKSWLLALALILASWAGAACYVKLRPNPTPVVRWQYWEFSHEGFPRDPKTRGGLPLYVHLSVYEWKWKGKPPPAKEVTSLHAILRLVGEYGWELAWTDERRFIFKRPDRDQADFGFLILDTPQP